MRYFFMVCIQVNHSWSLELFHNKFITKRCSKNFLPVLGEGCSISIIWSSFLSIFLIAWFVSELCPLYWLQTIDLPSVLFVPFVAFAVSNREKAKMNQNLIFRLRWLDWISWGWDLPSFSINYVGMSKDMEKRLPQLYYIKMKISYDLGFIVIRVAMAT